MMKFSTRYPALLLGLLTLLLVACSSNEIEEEQDPAPLMDFEAERYFKKVWSNSVGDGQGDVYNNLRPAIDDDMIFVASADGAVEAITLQTGKTAWDVDLDELVVGGVGVSKHLVMVGTAAGDVVALNRDSGETVWRAEVGGEVVAPPKSDGDLIFIQTFDGQLLGLESGTGKRLWSYRNSLPVLTLRGTSSPLLFRDSVIAGFANGRVIGFDQLTGAVRWNTRVAVAKGESEIQRLVDVDSDMLLSGPQLFVVSYQGKFVSLDPGTGRRMWDFDASSYVGLSEGFGNIYVTDASGSVTAYQKSGQGVRWVQTLLARRKLTGSATIGSYVVVGDFEGYLHALSQVDGHMAARTRVDSDGIRSDIQAVDDMLIVYGNSGKLAAYRLEERAGLLNLF